PPHDRLFLLFRRDRAGDAAGGGILPEGGLAPRRGAGPVAQPAGANRAGGGRVLPASGDASPPRSRGGRAPLARFHLPARPDQPPLRRAEPAGGLGQMPLGADAGAARRRSALRLPVGVLELLGDGEMDLPPAVSRAVRNPEVFRDAGAGASRLSAFRARNLGHVPVRDPAP